MAFVPAPKVVSFAAIFDQAGSVTENTFHYYVAAGVDLTKLHDIIHTYETWFTANTGRFSDSVALFKLYAVDLTTVGSWSLTRLPEPPLDGTNTGELQPNNVTFAIKRQTGHAGRKNRGRVYWPGIVRTWMPDSQHLSASAAGSLTDSLNALKDAQLADNGAVEVVLHRADGTHVEISSYSASDLALDSQRRRLPTRGR